MLIIGFMEGADPARGGLGLVGVATILRGVAARGHDVALVAGGACTPGQESFLTPSVERALEQKHGSGCFGIVTVRAARTWSFSPAILWKLNRHVRRADFVSLHSLYSFPVLAGYLLARFHGVPYGLWPHGVLATVQRRISICKKRVYDRLIARPVLKRASVLFFSAVGERDQSREVAEGTPSVIIPDGIDMADFDRVPPRGRFRRRYVDQHEGPLIVCVGRLNAKKGLDLLIESVRRVAEYQPNVRAAIIGPADPPEFKERVVSWMKDAGVESVTRLTGPVSVNEKMEALADADVFVSASEAENFGFAIFEAMACRVPVVVSDTLDYAEEIRARGAGLAVRRDPNSFADAILKLLNDETLRSRMSAKGRELAESFSYENTGRKVERTIHSIVERRPLPQDLIAPAKPRA
jgi:glycosyltransferase involved in cell wall biosynthesis